MRRCRRLLTLTAVVLSSVLLTAQPAPRTSLLIPQEPTPNLGQFKTRLIAYHDCQRIHGCYTPEVNRQSDLAIATLQRRAARAKQGEKLALVLDIDETSLSNWDEEVQDDFGYIAKDWNDWVDKKQAPAIEGTLRLYNEAVKHGVSVFFITGRPQSQEAATAENLKAAGYHDWAGLALRGPHPPTQKVAEYKSGERAKIVAAGYRIILNVGDQMSDLNGIHKPSSRLSCPIPFYFIP